MSTATQFAPPGPAPEQQAIRAERRLSRPVLWGLYAVGIVLGGALSALTGFAVTSTLVYGVVLGTLTVYVATRAVEGSRKATDRLVTCLVTTAFGLAMVPLASLVYSVLQRGLARFDAAFFTHSMFRVVGEGGGAYHAIVGTVIVTVLAAAISVPIGLMTAIYLVEYANGRLKRAITFFVDVMTGIPSIVAGLFSFALFTLLFGNDVRMAFMGSVALSVLMTPVVVRSCEEVLKLVPNELREASYALGVPKWRTVVKVVLPTAVAGLGTGITLSIARVVGETAPLLVTVGLITSTNFNPFDGRMATLPVFAYYQLTQPGTETQAFFDRAWTAALVLIVLVMALNLIARLISRFFAPKTGR